MKDDRKSPLIAQVVLLVLFVVMAGIGVVTVVLPEFMEDSAEDEAESTVDSNGSASNGDGDGQGEAAE